MKTLHGLDACPIEEITLCEVDGRLHSMKQELADISTLTRCVSEVMCCRPPVDIREKR